MQHGHVEVCTRNGTNLGKSRTTFSKFIKALLKIMPNYMNRVYYKSLT